MTNTTEPYTHELLKNFSSVVTSPETVRFSNSTASSQSDALRHRNLFIGVSGIVLNLSGILLLVTSRHVKSTLKISLLSLLVNDLMFLTVLFALGTLSSTLTTNHAFCWPVLYLSYTSVIVSYLSVCQLALQNYIAVFYPLSCNRIVTLTKVTLSTVVIWVMGFLVCLGCTGLKFEKNQLCIALVPVPTSGIGGIAVTCVICAGVVSAINIKIFTQIRRRNRRVGVAVPDDTSTSVRTVSENLQKSEFSPETLQVPSRLNIGLSTSTRIHSPLKVPVLIPPAPKIPKSTNDCNQVERGCHTVASSEFGNLTSHTHGNTPSSSVLNNEVSSGYTDCKNKISSKLDGQSIQIIKNKNSSPQYVCSTNGNASTYVTQFRQTSTSEILTLSEKLPSRTNIEQHSLNLNPQCSSISPNTVFSTSRFSMNERVERLPQFSRALRSPEKLLRRHGQAKIRNTILILTLWCCVVTLPFLVSMVILVSSKNFQKLTFAQSGVGIFVSSLVTVNVLGNPVLYAWRFIQWRKMFSKLRHWRRNFGLV